MKIIKIFCNKITWSLRRYRLKISTDSLVLEVGSGGNPYPRSNVLLDAYEDTRERHWESLVHDRPTVLSFAENLPFKDKVFDFVIAAHVLEHTAHPDKFLSELQRVSKAGYIETPDAFMERINPYKDHRIEVTIRNESLLIRKKKSWIIDPELVELYESRAKQVITTDTIPNYASNFHVRYFWKDVIRYSILNPEIDAAWSAPSISLDPPRIYGFKAKFRSFVLSIIRKVFSQNVRNNSLDITSLLRCPKCYSGDLKRKTSAEVKCMKCARSYKIEKNIYFVKA